MTETENPKNHFVEATDIAQKAVENIKDEKLKQIAFEKILDKLLSRIGSHKKATKSIRSEKPVKGKKAGGRKSGQQAWLEELIAENFFDKPKTVEDVLDVLESRGHHLKSTDIGTPLVRLVRAKKLRRKKEARGDSAGKVWHYSKW